jgi:hypothetical protein
MGIALGALVETPTRSTLVMAATGMGRPIVWSALLLALGGLGVGLYLVLPPSQRWQLEAYGPDFALAGRSMFLTRCCPPGERPTRLVLHDLQTGQPVRSLFAGVAHLDSPLVCAPNGNWIACTDQAEGIHVAAVADGAEHAIPLAADDRVRGMSFSPDGAYLAVELHSGKDDSLRFALLDTAAGKTLAEAQGHLTHVRFARDGALLVVVLERAGYSEIKSWDLHERRWTELNLRFPHIEVLGITGPYSRTLVLKRATEEGARSWTILDLERGTSQAGPEGSSVLHAAASQKGDRVAVIHGRKQAWQVDVWDADARHYVFHTQSAWRPEIALSPDGRRLALQATIVGDDSERTLTVFDVDSGQPLVEHRSAAHWFWSEPPPVFGPDGKSVVIYRGWHEPLHAEILDTETGQSLASLPLARANDWASAEISFAPAGHMHKGHLCLQPAAPPGWQCYLPPSLLHSDEGSNEWFIIDVQAKRVAARRVLESDDVLLLADGLPCVVTRAGSPDGATPCLLRCYDVPEQTPWHWIIAVPAGLGIAIAGLSALRNRSANKEEGTRRSQHC